MESIKIRQHIDRDGFLRIQFPAEWADKELEVMVVYQPVQTVETTSEVVPLEQLYGICADDLIVIDEAGISEALDDDLTRAFD